MNSEVYINKDFVVKWANKYPIQYDTENYYPYLAKARSGDKEALRKITEWKNSANIIRPMKFKNHRYKEIAFNSFVNNLNKYLPKGEKQLRADFGDKAPVWSIFWCHVLYGKPIFDKFTNIAFHNATSGKILCSKQATIPNTPQRWELYDQYTKWFESTLKKIQKQDHNLSTRDLDRALVMWGIFLNEEE